MKACEANAGVLTANGPGTDFNVLRNGKWIKHIKDANLTDDQPDFTDTGNTPGDVYEVVFWIGGQRIVVSCTDTTPPPTGETPAIDLTKFVNGFDANNAPGLEFRQRHPRPLRIASHQHRRGHPHRDHGHR